MCYLTFWEQGIIKLNCEDHLLITVWFDSENSDHQHSLENIEFRPAGLRTYTVRPSLGVACEDLYFDLLGAKRLLTNCLAREELCRVSCFAKQVFAGIGAKAPKESLGCGHTMLLEKSIEFF